MRRALLTGTALVSLFAISLQAGGQPYARADADRLALKLASLIARGGQPASGSAAPLRTAMTEREVNAYLHHFGPAFLPVGVVDPHLTIVDPERVETRAVVNLDTVRTARTRGWLDPLAYVSGSLEIRAVGKVRAEKGQGYFDLESATLGGVAMPKAFLQEVVSYYSRTETSPRGFQLDQPFDLPLQIRHVELRRGSAVIVQ